MSFFAPVFEQSKKKSGKPKVDNALFPAADFSTANSTQPVLGEDYKSVAQTFLPFARDVARGAAQDLASLPVYLGSKLLGKKEPELDPKQSGWLAPLIFGKEPFSITKSGTEFGTEVVGLTPETSSKIFPPLIAGLTALDFFSIPGKRQAITNAILRAKNLEEARSALRGAGVSDDVLKNSDILERAVAASKSTEIDSLFRDIIRRDSAAPVPTRSFAPDQPAVNRSAAPPSPAPSRPVIAPAATAPTPRSDVTSLQRLFPNTGVREAAQQTPPQTFSQPSTVRQVEAQMNPVQTQTRSVRDILREQNAVVVDNFDPTGSSRLGPRAQVMEVTTENLINKDRFSKREEAAITKLQERLTDGRNIEPISVRVVDGGVEPITNVGKQTLEAARRAGVEIVPIVDPAFNPKLRAFREGKPSSQGGYTRNPPAGTPETPRAKNKPVSSTDDNTSLSRTAQDAKTQPLSQAEIDKLPRTEQRVIEKFPEVGSAEGLRALRSQTRGTISMVEAEAAARKLNYTDRKVLDIKPGTILNKEEALALRGTIETSINVLERMEQRLVNLVPGSPEANALRVDISTQKMHIYKMKAIERGIAAEGGRLLESFKHNANAIAESEKKVVKMLSDVNTPQDVKDYILRRIGAFNGTPADFNKLLREVDQASVMDMVVEFATAMKLYAIPTHIVNTVTSLASMKLNLLNRTVAAAIDMPLAKIRGREREAFFADVRNEWIGQTVGWKDAGRQAAKAFADENYAWEARKLQDFQPRGPAIKGRPGKDTIFDKSMDVGGKAIRASFRLLGVEDVLIRTPSQMGAMYVELGRQAIKAGHKPGSKAYSEFIANGVHNPSQELLEMASKRADRDLFQETLHPFFADVQDFRNRWPGTKFIIPFFRTIVNLQKRAIEMSPAAPILPSVRKQLATPGESSEAIARMTMGTAAMIPLYFYAQEGGITLAAPKNPAERDAFFAEGKQPYSVKIGDKWYPYHRMSPFSEWFVTAGLVNEAVSNDDEKTLTELTTNTFFALSANMFDKSFATGLSDFLDAMTGAEYEREQWLRNFVTGSTMPTLLGNITRSQDPVVREVNSIKEAYMSRTPFLSTKLPPRRDVFGEEITRPGSAAARLISPIVPSPIQTNVVREELASLGMQLGFPERSVGSFKMEDHQYRLFKEITGKATYSALSQLVMSPEYQRLNARQKEQAINKVTTSIRSAVRVKVATDKAIAQELRKSLQDQGMTSAEATAKAEEIMKQLKQANDGAKK